MNIEQTLSLPGFNPGRWLRPALRLAQNTAFAILATAATVSATAADKKPNILVIFGDDIGQSNISAYSRGLMGFFTPNIDRIGAEGGVFVTYYGQQSCTAGRAAFITGQCAFRTGLTKVGLPGAKVGLQKEDPTIAEFLKPLGYICGQYGKNHLGDWDEFLPTNHGFDEFFGNLYHLNAEEEPENPDYPTLPAVEKVSHYLATYREFPPRQRPASFSIDQVIDKLQAANKGK
jgi:arylsulfatase